MADYRIDVNACLNRLLQAKSGDGRAHQRIPGQTRPRQTLPLPAAVALFEDGRIIDTAFNSCCSRARQ